jgi:hypothetical protein
MGHKESFLGVVRPSLKDPGQAKRSTYQAGGFPNIKFFKIYAII